MQDAVLHHALHAQLLLVKFNMVRRLSSLIFIKKLYLWNGKEYEVDILQANQHGHFQR